MTRYMLFALLFFSLLPFSATAAPDHAVASVLKQNEERVFVCYRLRLMPSEGICVSLNDLTLANAKSAAVIGKYLSERLANNVSKRRSLIIPAKLNILEDVHLSCESAADGPADIYLTLEPVKAQHGTVGIVSPTE